MHASPVSASAQASPQDWVRQAVARIEADFQRSADTHLIALSLPGFAGIDLYLKDESSHPTGSLKHRLARSLFLYALCNGRLRPGQTVVDASSGSTAISEAWFARLLGLPFVAVMPRHTAPRKIRDVRALGGECDLVDDAAAAHARAAAHAAAGACHLDQFGLAERATDWRGNNNIAESILGQLAREPDPQPAWIVCGAGTGGTSATIGRYLRYRRLPTRLCVAEPCGGAFAEGWRRRDPRACARATTLIEGIGRPRVEPSFMPQVLDAVCKVPDALSLAAMHYLARRLNRRVGASSGTNLVGALLAARQMVEAGESGSVVTILCDGGERYATSYYCEAWLAEQGYELAPLIDRVAACVEQGGALPDIPRSGL